MVADTAEVFRQNREVTSEEVKSAIIKYAETKQNEGAKQIATTLKTAEIKFAGLQVTLIINNETQKEQFMSVRQNFVDTLRLELQNSDLAFEVLISKQDIQPRAYKPMDVFKAMAEKNPALLELKKRFDLEIDY
jgi:DNA polymerase-3 subunit gamma/tau